MIRTSITILFIIVLLSCSSRPNTNHEFRVFLENGLTIAETSGGPRFQGELFSYEKVVEIRSDTTNQEAILYRPFACIVDSDGHVYVADSSNHRIAVFDFDGNYLRSIGREGDGPGEFRYPMSVLLIDGKLQIPSGRQQRTTIYNTDGSLNEIVSYSHARTGSFAASATIAPDGTRVIQRSIREQSDGLSGRSFGYCTVTPGGDTLAFIETPVIMNSVMADRGTTDNIRFSPNPQAYYAPNRGIYLSTGLPPEIDLFGLDGSHLKKIRILLETEPVTAGDRAFVRSYYNELIANIDTRVGSEFAERGPAPAELYEQIRDSAVFANVKAHWIATFVDNSGFIWLKKPERTGESTYETYNHEYYVLSPEGELLGLTTTPMIDFGYVSNGYLQASISDSDTGEMVPTIFRIKPAVKGLEYP